MVQLQVLNKILKDKDSSMIVLNNLTEEYFSDYSNEFNFIKNHLDRYGNIPDLESFLSKFSDFEIINVEERSSYLISELVSDKNTRNLANVFNKIRSLLMEGKTDEAMTLFKNSSDTLSTGIALQCVDIIKDTSRYDAYVERTKDFEKFYIKTGFSELDKIIGGWDREEELATIVARTNYGKCLEKGTEVLMYDGSIKRVEDVAINDKVQSLNSINTVIGLHNGISKGYKIIPTMGESFVVSENHILTLMKRNVTWNKETRKQSTDNTYTLVDMMIEDYLSLSEHQKRLYRLYKPVINYDNKELSIPPYILGTWLGDGTARASSITSKDAEIINEWQSFASSLNLQLHKYSDSKKNSLASTYSLTALENRGTKNGNVSTQLFKKLNLLNNKHIPQSYMTSDYNQRLDLLAGILDTDGYYDGYVYTITQKNLSLIKQISLLASSLGLRTSKVGKKYNKKFNKTYHTLTISGNISIIPVRLQYKKAIKQESTKRILSLSGFKIEEVEQIEYYGFMCDGDHRFLLADGTLTHNTWVLLKCAVASAEQGLKVGIYSGEMSEKKIGYRLDTLVGHISNGSIIHGNIAVQNDYKRYIDSLSTRFTGSIKVLTPNMIDGPAGVSSLRTFIEKENLDILFVDQHSLLEDDRKAKNSIEKAANISKDLKNLQVMKRVPIISVSQQNRTKNEEGVDTTQIAQSDRIGQDSTVIIFLEKKEDLLKMTLVKSRDSENGKSFTYRVDFDKGLFVYIPESENNDLDDLDDEDSSEKYRGRYESSVDDKEVF